MTAHQWEGKTVEFAACRDQNWNMGRHPPATRRAEGENQITSDDPISILRDRSIITLRTVHRGSSQRLQTQMIRAVFLISLASLMSFSSSSRSCHRAPAPAAALRLRGGELSLKSECAAAKQRSLSNQACRSGRPPASALALYDARC